MQTVLPLELAGKTILEFDLFDEKGNLLLKKGSNLPFDLIMELNSKNMILYKLESTISLEDFAVEPENSNDKFKKNCIFNEKSQESLLKNSKKIIQSIVDGGAIDVKSCNEIQNIVVSDVASKMDQVKGIYELRVYDKYTFSHTINVSSMSTALGLMLNLKEEQINELALGALLHDVGKLLVPKEILLKPGRLEPEEFEIMKGHTTKGYEYIKEKNDIPEHVAKVALEHQEKYSGIGYPGGLKANEINYYAQIVAIIDVYDALISERVYKKALSNSEAIRILLAEGSKCFNPFMLYRFIYLANNRDKSKIVE